MKTVVLGAGLTGLELGKRLKGLGEDFLILEKESRVGGLCRTNETAGYYWDFAVHALYSRNKEVMEYFQSLPLDYERHNREVKIVHSDDKGNKHLLEYPFEIGIRDLPLKDKLECISGYIGAHLKKERKYTDLKDWIDHRLGFGIAKHFMIPYNSKIWSCDIAQISEKLVSSKIEPEPVVKFIVSALGKKTIGREYQARFIYPKQGIQKLIDYTARQITDKVFLNSTVEKLTRHNGKWIVSTQDGSQYEADRIVSTIPLVELLRMLEVSGVEKEYVALKWNDTFFVMVGLKQGCDFNIIKDCHWAFFKEEEIFYRVTLMHNFSSALPPALVAEVTKNPDQAGQNEEDIKKRVVDDLLKSGIVKSPEEIVVTDIKFIPYTYAIPTVGLSEVKGKVSALLQQNNIFLLGRNGNWDYINMDGVISKVAEFIDREFNSRN